MATAQRAGLAGSIGFVAGSVALVCGGVLILTAPRAPKKAKLSWSVGPGGGSIAVGGTF